MTYISVCPEFTGAVSMVECGHRFNGLRIKPTKSALALSWRTVIDRTPRKRNPLLKIVFEFKIAHKSRSSSKFSGFF